MSEQSTEDIKAMLRKQNEQMNHQGKQIQQLIWQVVGSPSNGIEGMKPTVAKMANDVHELKKWRNEMWKIDLAKVFTKETITTGTKIFLYSILAAVVGGGGTFAINEFLKALVSK